MAASSSTSTRSTHVPGRSPRTTGGLFRLLKVSLLALFALAACDHITTPDAGEPDAIALYPSKAALEEGDLVQLQVTDASKSGVQASGVSVDWQTSDPTVATVNNGMVRGVKPGQARISARTQSGKAAEATIEVGRTPAQIVLLTEGELEAEVGWSLDEPLEARVLSARGLPVAGAEVRFRVTKGAGSTSPVIAVADEDGIVRSDWRLGPVAGEQVVELEAMTHSGTRATVQAEAHPGAPDRIVVSPSQVALRLGAPFQFSAQVSDRYGNKLASIPVEWSSTNPDVVRVNTEGWVTGIAPGTAVVEAVPATWNMTAASAALVEQVAASPGNGKGKGQADVTVSDADDDGSGSQVSVTSGDDQIGVVGTTLGEELGIRVTDGNGDPVRQFDVTWTVVEGDGSVSQTKTRTDGQGRASVEWTLGPVAGTQRVEAQAGDLGSVTFRAEALVGPVETVTVTPGSGTIEVDAEMDFSASAEDKFGNPIEGSLNATWSVADGSTASVSSQGRAKGLAAGTTQVVASVEGVTGDADLAVEGSSSDDGSGDSDSDSGGDDTGDEATADPGQVTDLAVVSTAENSATLRFTEVDDGTGNPAQYHVRYHLHPIGSDWEQATPVAEGSCTDPVQGQTVGSELDCAVGGLDPDVQYDFQLVAFRVEDGKRVLGSLSNVATGTTASSNSGDTDSDSTGDDSGSGGDDTSGEETTDPGQVTDLAVVSTTENSATLRFTEVDDGTGNPAQYHVRYHLHPIEWGWGEATPVAEGSCTDPVQGQTVGSELTCVAEGLDPDVKYDFQLVAFRVEDGKRVFGTLSNVATGTTAGSNLNDDAVAEVRITEDTVSFSALGDEVTLEATALDADGGIVSGASIDWASTDEEVAVVNSSGTVLAKGVGIAMVVASAACCEAATADSVTVQVDQKVAAVEVDPSSITLEEGNTQQLSGVALDANGFLVADAEFSWSSSDTAVASVSSTGGLKAESAGSANVTAQVDGVDGLSAVTVQEGGDGSSASADYPNLPSGMTKIGASDGSVLGGVAGTTTAGQPAFGIEGFNNWWEFSGCGDPRVELVEDSSNPTGSNKAIRLTLSKGGCGAIATAWKLGGSAWDELYIMARIYIEPSNWDNGGSGNKWFYVNTNGQSSASRHYVGRPDNTIPNQLRWIGHNAHEQGGLQFNANDVHTQGEWINLEFHLIRESAGGAGDGRLYSWRNGTKIGESTSVPWAADGEDPRLAIMQWYGHFSSSGGGEREGSSSYRIGELYIAGR